MSRVPLSSSIEPVADLKQQRLQVNVSGRRLLLALGVWLVAAAVVGTVTAVTARVTAIADATPIIVAEVYVLLVVALVGFVRPHTSRALGLSPFRIADVGLAAAACGAAYLVTAALQSAGGPWPWSSTIAILEAIGSDDGRLATASPGTATVIIVRACLLAAVAEEMLFRGVFYAWLRKRLGAGAAISITAASHSAIHMFPAVLPLAFVMGLGFGWIRERCGSTIPTIIVHALHNALLIALAYLSNGWTVRLPAWGRQ